MTEQLTFFSLMFCKAMGLVIFLPLDILPQGFALKILLMFLLAIAAYLNFEQSLTVNIMDYPLQFMYGFAQTLPILLLLQVLEMLGDLIEALRGQSLGAILSPMSQTENSILPILLRSLLWILMIQAGLFETIFSAFMRNLNQQGFDLIFWKNSLDLAFKILPLGMAVALVFAFLVLAIEICLGFLYKLLTNFQLDNLGFVARSLICGFALLALLNTGFMSSFVKLYMRIVYE